MDERERSRGAQNDVVSTEMDVFHSQICGYFESETHLPLDLTGSKFSGVDLKACVWKFCATSSGLRWASQCGIKHIINRLVNPGEYKARTQSK